MEKDHEQLLQASTELTNHSLGYVKSMAVRCAARLGIGDAIHRSGGRASLADLHAALSLHPTKLAFLRRVIRVFVTTGLFAQDDDEDDNGGCYYRLTPMSSLLVTKTGDDDSSSSSSSLLPFVLLMVSPMCETAAMGMIEWLKSGGEEKTPFEMVYGAAFWSSCGRSPELGASFNDAMAADSAFIVDAGHVFDNINSLVDVAGGVGGAARAVAAAFPHIKCTVLDLPQVVDSIAAADHGDDVVQFVAGDMMDFIPKADALLLKFVLHDWSDKDCIRILKRCKEAIPSRDAGGKIIIIDIVMGSSSQAMCHGTQQLFDLIIAVLTPGKERDEKEWWKIFKEAGFTKYKISPVLGTRSIIEVFP
uniref:O-methyltransferase domain-containing protein n=1 Tax=Leersia perrieri TaxID=77586 RepID=A0A0D9WYK4_9ORYZ